MKCVHCRAETNEQRRDVPYDSLPGTTLIDVPVHVCPECGETYTGIPKMAELDRTLVEMVISQDSRLTPDEIAFVRKYLGLSGRDLAARMGVAPETVSRWENGKQTMSESHERLLRALVVIETPVEDYSQALPGDGLSEPQPWEARMAARDDRWIAASAA